MNSRITIILLFFFITLSNCWNLNTVGMWDSHNNKTIQPLIKIMYILIHD